MKSHLIRPLILGVFTFPLLVAAQQGGEGRPEPAVLRVRGAQGQGQAAVAGSGQVAGAGSGQVTGVASGSGVAVAGSGQVAGAGSGGVVSGVTGRGETAAGGPGQGGTGDVTVYSDPGNNFFSNVPINELSAKAYRRFHRRFREVPTGEYWFKYDQGYQVSFLLDQHHTFVYYDTHGVFVNSVKYFQGNECPGDLTQLVKRRYPDYKIDIVTEVSNGVGTFYVVQIMNPEHIKELTLIDGRINVVKDLTNGSANIGYEQAAR